MKTIAGWGPPPLAAVTAAPPDALLVGLDRAEGVVDVVAAELLAVGAGEGEGDHRLADDAGGRDDGRVGALAHRLAGSLGLGVDRAKRLGQGRDRLDRGPHDQRLAVGHAALEPAGAVGLAVPAALLAEEDLVVGLRAGAARDVPGLAERDALDRLDRDDRLRQAAVELLTQETCEPRPGTRPKARTSKLPPRLSFSLRRRSISSTIAALVSASRQRTGESSTPSKSSGARSSRSGASTEAIRITWLWT